ncbi:hypothetical protein L286_23215 [Sphingobium sp. HDIP04]|nr:hypothetical protein L286_23215 [Sphingobium sp. HDIP04]
MNFITIISLKDQEEAWHLQKVPRSNDFGDILIFRKNLTGRHSPKVLDCKFL